MDVLTPVPDSPGGPGLPASPVSPYRNTQTSARWRPDQVLQWPPTNQQCNRTDRKDSWFILTFSPLPPWEPIPPGGPGAPCREDKPLSYLPLHGTHMPLWPAIIVTLTSAPLEPWGPLGPGGPGGPCRQRREQWDRDQGNLQLLYDSSGGGILV